MGVIFCLSPCIVCRTVFSYNPVRVPSTIIFSADGHTREPVCRSCMDALNAKRAAAGMEPFPVASDAYEAVEESEVF